ncbi:alpha/beta fold hydrolase [Skermanella sp. TT6]|uniref:Probable acyltransferase n=1 Tax=Skermanella cutis TaxID=2775420 RepID=A0ABX7BDU1_9PROT|nr:alpha/beta fold hydrolase [Skermanella sp. TT6]QQP91910.1 alpha/beta fold hydrolase [Skermanella sp. TT6]
MNEWISRARAACVAVAIGAAAGAAPALADRDGDPPHQRFELGDFQLENGQVIESGFLTYVTHGTLNEQESNAVLVLPALMATHHRHDFLIGPGKALDPEKFFIIAADTLGNGRAISPSNSETQPGISFPQFSIRDMVAAQHRLVTEGLGLERLLAVVGLSMGGMQAYQWAVSHPDTMAAIVPIVSMGRTSPWVTAIWESQRQAIMADAAWAGGDYVEQPTQGLRAAAAALEIWTRHWDGVDRQFEDNGSVIEWLDARTAETAKAWDANDFIYQTRAEDLHDIAAGGDYAAAFRRIQARALLMPGTRDLLHPAADARFAAKHIPRSVLVEIESDQGHMASGIVPEDVEFVNDAIRRFLNEVLSDLVKI